MGNVKIGSKRLEWSSMLLEKGKKIEGLPFPASSLLLPVNVLMCLCGFLSCNLTKGGGFSANWTNVAENCLKWIDSVSEFFPLWSLGDRVISVQFSGMIIFSIELYNWDHLCSKCMKKVLSVTWLTRQRHINIIS